MKPILTTITPYWKRPEMLACWIQALKGSTIPQVQHFIFTVGESVSPDLTGMLPPNVFIFMDPDSSSVWDKSIGHYHNLGAKKADTEWIMKMDVDCIPNELYFSELVEVLKNAPERKWFNGGMLYVNQDTSEKVLSKEAMPLKAGVYEHIMRNRERHSSSANALPAASNFICRRKDYLDLGGCLESFKGYGWQDYQQLYMLEKHEREGADPLPGPVGMQDCTTRCRDEISRPRALELWAKNKWLVLLHRWHPKPRDTSYMKNVGRNRILLFNYIKGEKSK